MNKVTECIDPSIDDSGAVEPGDIVRDKSGDYFICDDESGAVRLSDGYRVHVDDMTYPVQRVDTVTITRGE